MLSRAKRGTRRINASKSARWGASMGLAAGRKAISTPGAFFRGWRSKSGKVGEPSGFLKSPERATRNLLAMQVPSLDCSPAFGAQGRYRLGQGVVQHPDVARITDEVETLGKEID